MARCPACGHEVPDIESAVACPNCRLSTELFEAVQEAAGTAHAPDPAYLRTIAELLASVDLNAPPEPPGRPAQGLLSRPSRFPSLTPPPALTPTAAPRTEAPPIEPFKDLPALPPPRSSEELRRQIDEQFETGRRLGLDFTDFERRAAAAGLVDDTGSREVLAREMFVHLTSALAEEYESVLARRNELAPLVRTPSADVEIAAIQRAMSVGDLSGAQRRLAHVRDELTRVEEEWEVGRILVTECDLLARALRDLGGDPSAATGPIEEGRKQLGEGHRTEGERLLARGAVALWALLEPRLFEDLRRLRDRMVELRSGGLEVAPAVNDLRAIAIELRQRNFVGTLGAYQRLRAFIDRASPPETVAGTDAEVAVRPSSPFP